MDWIRQHTDTSIVLGAMFIGLLWMNSQFNDIKKDILVIKTVLVMKGIIPDSLAKDCVP